MTREEAQREMPNIFRECIECEHSNVGDYALVAEKGKSNGKDRSRYTNR